MVPGVRRALLQAISDGVDTSPGGLLLLIHHHVALGVHLHALLWETAPTMAPVLPEIHLQRCLGGVGGLCWPQQQLLCSQLWGHGRNTILCQALETRGTLGDPAHR